MKRFILKISLALLVIIICLLLLEVFVRLNPIPIRATFEREKVLFEDLSVNEKSSHQKDFELVISRNRWSFNTWGFYGNSPIKTESINFIPYHSVTARACPDSLDGNSSKRIWFFGGSTMEDLHVVDKRTIANQTISFLNGHKFYSHGLNFGTSSHNSSVELAKFIGLLREVPISERPEYVIFYDGFNDAIQPPRIGVAVLQGDIEAKFRTLVEQNHKNLSIYGLSMLASEYSEFYKRYISNLLMPTTLISKGRGDVSRENLNKAVECYINNINLIKAICLNFNITPIFALQPLVTSKKPLGVIDKKSLEEIHPTIVNFVRLFYEEIKQKASTFDEFVDLSAVLDDNNRSDFRDLGHTGPYAQKDIAFALANFIINIEIESVKPN